MTAAMTPGFDDPVAQTQSAFRALMEAMARPGRIQTLPAPAAVPDGLHAAAAAIMLTLADADTRLWTDAPLRARDWIVFHTGVQLADAPEDADVLLATGTPPALLRLRAGTDEAPQDGATLVLQLPGLDGGAEWRLAGPGIADRHALRPHGLPPGFIAEWARNGARFPRGCDLFLVSGRQVAGLPRTTRIEEAA